jgi:tripeptide aminopeptidase
LDKNLVNTFCELVRIPSPSGYELDVARYVQRYLKGLGVESHIDGAGRLSNSNAGNVIAKLGKGRPRIMFVAHIDTVEDGKKAIRPVISKGVIRSDGTTILGSDDKAGVAALLAGIKEMVREKSPPTIYCVFSIREENGIMGVNYLNLDKDIDFVFDIDGSSPPGQFINKALGNIRFELQLYGREAHAAANPENGLNAIKASGIIISKLKLGRDSKWRALNIGTVSGGTKDNVIPGHCILTGEVRAFTVPEAEGMLNNIRKAAEAACKDTGCRYKLIEKGRDPPLYIKETERIVSLARKAAAAAGIKFSLLTLPATIQGNNLSAKGYAVLGLSKGGRLAHSKMEYIRIKELEETKRLIVEIVKQSERLI